MVGLIALGLVLVNLLGTAPARRSSKSEAVAIARPRIDFVPQDHQIRFIRRGIPPRGFWVVSFFIRKPGRRLQARHGRRRRRLDRQGDRGAAERPEPVCADSHMRATEMLSPSAIARLLSAS